MLESMTPDSNGVYTRNRFYIDCLAYLLKGGLRLRGGHQPQQGVLVPPDYSGICVASQEDPEADATIIGYLNELGIRHVRMDFTYD